MYRTLALSLLLLIGCTESPDAIDVGSTSEATLTEFTSVSREVATEAMSGSELKTPAAYLREPGFAGADRARGELLSLACQACHTLGEGENVLLGPNLFGIFGRASAATESFDYSPVLSAAQIVWTPAILDVWVTDPEEFLPGNDMVFAGYSSATDRRDLIAFLLHKTSGLAD